MGAAFYIEVSARDGTNVEDIFKKFATHFGKKAGGAADDGPKGGALEPLPKEAAKKKKSGC
jgi:hypothetical protein